MTPNRGCGWRRQYGLGTAPRGANGGLLWATGLFFASAMTRPGSNEGDSPRDYCWVRPSSVPDPLLTTSPHCSAAVPQSGNILYNDKSSSSAKITPTLADPTESPGPVVSLIDYEYAGYNPRGFDVGNHFCEWMADYSTAEPHVLDLERFPSPQERRMFSRAYLGAMNGVSL